MFEEELHELIRRHAGRDGTWGIIVAMRRTLRSFVEQEPSMESVDDWEPPTPLGPDADLPSDELMMPA